MSDETTVEVGGEEIRISSPERVIFPKQGWTKLDVANHFARVAEGAVRGVYGRPTMLKRFMGTVDDPPIYHKRAAKNTPFETVQIRFPSQRPGMMNVPRTEGDVVRLVQLGCLDFHPWPVRAEDIDHPDELRFDFDPTPGFGFDKVKEAAAGMRSLLEEVGLQGWPKTSGSRGIHVYVPIARGPVQKDVWRLAKALAVELASRNRRLLTSEYRVAKRPKGTVLVDYNQNAWGQTLASVYSVRPHPRALVSAPVTWDEVADGIRLEDLHVGNVPARLRALGDLWAPLVEGPERVCLPSVR